MKVLHVIPSLSAVHGGPTKALALMERELLSRGINVETVTTDDDGPGRHNGKPCGVALEEDGATRRYFNKTLDFYKASPSMGRWLARHARDYDLLHIHAMFSFSSIAAARAALRAKVPYVIRPLGTLSPYGVTQRRPWLKQASLALLDGPALRGAAAVHFTSDAERDEALMLGITIRPVVIPLGVELPEKGDGSRFLARHPAAAHGTRLLYLSRLDPKKNVEGLIQALRLLLLRGMTPTLIVAGDGEPDYVRSLKALAAAQGVAGQIIWLGHVSGDAKADALAAADVYVLPSFSENFGIAVAEALALGLPCVVGHGVALAAAVAAAGAGIAVGTDGESIADGLARYISAESLRRSAGVAAAALAARDYSASSMGRRLNELYSLIASNI